MPASATLSQLQIVTGKAMNALTSAEDWNRMDQEYTLMKHILASLMLPAGGNTAADGGGKARARNSDPEPSPVVMKCARTMIDVLVSRLN